MAASVPTAADFVDSYPEFDGSDVDLVNAKLAEAARRTNDTLYATSALITDAVMLRAAILLLLSPQGRKLRLASPDQIGAWEYQLFQMQRTATAGIRVF